MFENDEENIEDDYHLKRTSDHNKNCLTCHHIGEKGNYRGDHFCFHLEMIIFNIKSKELWICDEYLPLKRCENCSKRDWKNNICTITDKKINPDRDVCNEFDQE